MTEEEIKEVFSGAGLNAELLTIFEPRPLPIFHAREYRLEYDAQDGRRFDYRFLVTEHEQRQARDIDAIIKLRVIQAASMLRKKLEN